MGIKKDILWRIYIVFGLIVLLGCAIIFQAFKIQVVEGEHWRNLADSLTTSYESIEAERGNVYADDGRFLATLLPYFEVRMDVNTSALTNEIFYNKVDSLAHCMANYFQDAPPKAYKNYLISARKSGKRYLLIKRKVTYPQLQVMKTWPLFRRGQYKGGFIAIQKNKRVTPFKMLAHRTIGYVRDEVQPVGLEGRFNKYLAGVEGKRLMQRISGGVKIPINDDNEIESQNGLDLITTINIDLQDVAETALLKTLNKHNADHGCVIVMEVKTGQIKAIANLGRVEEGKYWEKYNYAVGESTEPGSTFKLASMLALFKDGKVKPEDSVDLEGGIKRYYDKDMPDSELHGHNNVTVATAFEISSNVGISKLIYKYYAEDPKVFVNHLKALNLGKKTGIEIDGEPNPFINTPDESSWSGIALPWMSVGYGVQLTPLQTLCLYNAVANDGAWMKPYLVSAIQEYGSPVVNIEPEQIGEKIASDKVLKQVQMLLKGVAERGTARYIQSDGYKIAGKTGTAKIADKKKGYRKIYLASFAGYFPADDPQYSCIVVVNAPSNGVYYGSLVAGPVFKEIADKVYASSTSMHASINETGTFYTDNIPYAKVGYRKDVSFIYNKMGISNSIKEENEWVSCTKKDHSMELTGRKVIKGLVPNVKGMGLRDAIYLLENEGLQVEIKGYGRVRNQSLVPGQQTIKGQKIKIELS